jgi:hypothetical protein
MLLVDTSVWIEYLKGGYPRLETILRASYRNTNDDEIVTHEMVIAELANSGNLPDGFFDNLLELRRLKTVGLEEYLKRLSSAGIHGMGVGYVDINLLFSCMDAAASLCSLDKKLLAAADATGVGTRQLK